VLKAAGELVELSSLTPSARQTGSIATISLSLAHWWQALCSGSSQDSLTTMATRG